MRSIQKVLNASFLSKKIAMKKCRLFLKTPENTLKKIYSIGAPKNGKSIQTQIMSNLMCRQYGIPLNSEIHYSCPSNGKDLHLSIKYIDQGPFDNPKTVKVENYLTIFSSKEEYKHKQVIWEIDQVPITNIQNLALSEEMRTRFMIGYLPDSFDKYLENKVLHPIYYFPTISTPITPLTTQELEVRPWEMGDSNKTPPSENDIVIEESYEPDVRINVCGFFCIPGHYPYKDEAKQKSKFISIPSLPDFGISVIFS